MPNAELLNAMRIIHTAYHFTRMYNATMAYNNLSLDPDLNPWVKFTMHMIQKCPEYAETYFRTYPEYNESFLPKTNLFKRMRYSITRGFVECAFMCDHCVKNDSKIITRIVHDGDKEFIECRRCAVKFDSKKPTLDELKNAIEFVKNRITTTDLNMIGMLNSLTANYRGIENPPKPKKFECIDPDELPNIFHHKDK